MRIFSVAFLIAFQGVVSAQQSQPQTPGSRDADGQAQEQAQSQRNETPTVPRITAPEPSLNISAAPSEITKNPTGQQTQSDWYTNPDWWTVGLTALGGVTAIILVVIAGCQFRLQARQMRASLRLTGRGLAQTRRAAEAAETSANIARQTLIVAHRAYLTIPEIQIDPMDGITTELRLTVHNSGRLAATITGWACIAQDEPLLSIPQRQRLIWSSNAGPVGPGKDAPLSAQVTFDKWASDDWKAVRLGRKPLNIWGVIRYETGFPDVDGETGFGVEYDIRNPNSTYGKKFAATDIAGYNYAK